MPVDNASRCDQTIDGIADGAATLPKRSEIHGSRNSEFLAASSNQFEFLEFAPDLREHLLTANTLKNLTENEVGQPESLSRDLVVEPLCFAIPKTTEIINPNGGINDHHCVSGSSNCPSGIDSSHRPIKSSREGGAERAARVI